MLNKLKQMRDANEEGFTLIELLVVIIIIGILAAIAIPIFMNQQKAAHTAALKSDIHNATIAIQTWVSKNPNANQFDADELIALGKYTEGTWLAVYGIPTDYCIGGDAVGDGLDGSTYLTYESVTGELRDDILISGRSCYSHGGAATQYVIASSTI